MKNRFLTTTIMAVSTCVLTGCGAKFPEMTQQQYDQTVQYASGLLMRYSNNGVEKLQYVDVDRYIEAKEEQAKAEAAMQESSSQAKSEVDSDATQFNQGAEGTTDTLTVTSDSHLSISDEISIGYNGYEVLDEYPENTENAYFVQANEGNKLLVMRFSLYNDTQEQADIDLLSRHLLFNLELNGDNIGNTMFTLLDDDLTTYQGILEPEETVDLVLLCEIEEEKAAQIEDLTLEIKDSDSTSKINLK